MAVGLMDKLTNFLMPIEESADQLEPQSVERVRGGARLKVHSNAVEELKMIVLSPQKYEDVRLCAAHLKNNVAVIVNYEHADLETQQCMLDFLNGVCFVLSGMAEKISERIFIYVPRHVEISKKLFAYSLPTYVKQKD